jgi:D-cysteine desulfhydrase
MNESAASVSDRTAALATAAPIFASPAFAYVWAWGRRLRGARWIAAGGSTPLGALGHVNAGLELVDQIDAGLVPSPARVVVPLGTGGTMAGLALAFAIAQRSIDVLGVRVVPRIVAHRSHVLRLANQTARFIEQRVHARVARVSRGGVVIAHEQYGGAYGRETPAAREARERARLAASVGLDATYSAKAFAFALSAASRGPTLFWLTFDSRPLDAS